MPCDFSKFWHITVDPTKCSESLAAFGTLSQNVWVELDTLKSVTHELRDKCIDVKALVSNRISPYNIDEHLARLSICQFHLVRQFV